MINKPITLTLVIPAYNEERYLSRCLNSIKKQTVLPNEVIVVNNNSSDKTVRIAGEYPFVKVVKENNQGIVFARNRGFNLVKSDLIGRIDADSVLDEHWVEEAIKYFSENSDVAAITGDTDFYDTFLPSLSKKVHNFVYFNVQSLISHVTILWASNMVITTASWREVRDICNRTNYVHEDIDLSLCLDKQGKIIKKQNTVKVSVSLRRGEFRFKKTWHYLRAWPRTYFKRQLYIKGLLVYIVAVLVLLSGLFLFLWHFLFRRQSA